MIVYKTVNTVSLKYYIGKDEKANPDYLGSGLAFGRAIKKYGRDKFVKEIIEECIDSESLAERERFWIKEYGAVLDSNSYNIHEHRKTVTSYTLTSPDGTKFILQGKDKLSIWCKENNYSIWTVERRLLQNIQPKYGTLVGWTAKSTHNYIVEKY